MTNHDPTYIDKLDKIQSSLFGLNRLALAAYNNEDQFARPHKFRLIEQANEIIKSLTEFKDTVAMCKECDSPRYYQCIDLPNFYHEMKDASFRNEGARSLESFLDREYEGTILVLQNGNECIVNEEGILLPREDNE